jgi:hypothetical protein
VGRNEDDLLRDPILNANKSRRSRPPFPQIFASAERVQLTVASALPARSCSMLFERSGGQFRLGIDDVALLDEHFSVFR